MRSGECGVRNGKARKALYSLVVVEVLGCKIIVVALGRRPALHGRKTGHLGHCKKSFFDFAKKPLFSALLDHR